MPSYLGNGPLYTQIKQILEGVTPGGIPALRDFFARHHVRVDEVVQALEAAGVSGPAATVSWHVAQHPELREWYESTGGGYTRADIDAAVAEERERCAMLVAAMDNDYLRTSPCRKALERAARAIRQAPAATDVTSK